MNKTKVLISGESHKWVHKTGHVVFVVQVLVETQYSTPTNCVRNGCTRSVVA